MLKYQPTHSLHKDWKQVINLMDALGMSQEMQKRVTYELYEQDTLKMFVSLKGYTKTGTNLSHNQTINL